MSCASVLVRVLVFLFVGAEGLHKRGRFLMGTFGFSSEGTPEVTVWPWRLSKILAVDHVEDRNTKPQSTDVMLVEGTSSRQTDFPKYLREMTKVGSNGLHQAGPCKGPSVGMEHADEVVENICAAVFMLSVIQHIIAGVSFVKGTTTRLTRGSFFHVVVTLSLAVQGAVCILSITHPSRVSPTKLREPARCVSFALLSMAISRATGAAFEHVVAVGVLWAVMWVQLHFAAAAHPTWLRWSLFICASLIRSTATQIMTVFLRQDVLRLHTERQLKYILDLLTFCAGLYCTIWMCSEGYGWITPAVGNALNQGVDVFLFVGGGNLFLKKLQLFDGVFAGGPLPDTRQS